MSLLVAILWMPLMMHCEMEALLGLGAAHSASCADHGDELPAGACDECRVCQTVDHGLVTPGSALPDLKPALVPLMDLGGGATVEVRLTAPEPDPSPPERRLPPPDSWHLLARAVHGPRAPSALA